MSNGQASWASQDEGAEATFNKAQSDRLSALARASAAHRHGGSPNRSRREIINRRQAQRRLLTSSYHQARVLVLMHAVTDQGRRPLTGLTKLAKLDFLLRYPVFLEQLAELTGRKELPAELAARSSERQAVESRMMRYKYGPWDHEYYNVLGALQGKGLIKLHTGPKNSLKIELTDAGLMMAESFAQDSAWVEAAERARYIRQVYGSMTGNKLKELIYEHLSDAIDRPYRELI